VVAAIELFFPHTIDKLVKESSNIEGLKPLILDTNQAESLFYILLGNDGSTQKGGEGGGLLQDSKVAEFGCDQVIIVRDQESKERLPKILQHALCLTVYEAKGLEFDDVVLYNFFTDSKVIEMYKLLKEIQIEQKLQKKQEGGLVDFEELDKPEDEEEEEEKKGEEEGNKEEGG